MDSTTIDLCLNLFPWAKFRKKKAAIKLRTLLNLRGSIPTFIEITPVLVHDIHILDILIVQPGAFYIMDRAYLDFKRLFQINQQGAYFVLRAKENLQFKDSIHKKSIEVPDCAAIKPFDLLKKILVKTILQNYEE